LIFNLSRSLQRKLMYMVIFLLWFSNYSYVPVLSTYCTSVGASLTVTGLVISSYGLVQMFSRIPLGVLSDLLKSRRIFLFFGLIVSFLSSLGFLLFSSSYMLIFCRTLAGLAVSNWAIFVTAFCCLDERNETNRSMGTASALMAAGQGVGVFLGGVIAQTMGIHWTFIVSVVTSLIGIVLLFGIEETYIPSSHKYSARDFEGVIKDSALLFFSGLALLLQAVNCSSLTGFVPSLLNQAGANDFQKGLGTSLAIFPTIFSAPFAINFLDKKIGTKFSLCVGFILLAIPMFLFASSKSIPLLLALEFIAGCGRGMLFALLMAHSTSHLPASTRSTALSAFQAIYGAGMWIGPAITGYVSDRYSLKAAFNFLGIIGFIGIAGCFLYLSHIDQCKCTRQHDCHH
jgi:MFS family permease